MNSRDREEGADLALAPPGTCQGHSRRPPTPLGENLWFLQKRVSRARDPNRRLGGALAAQSRFQGPLQKVAEDGADPGAAGASKAFCELAARTEPAYIVARAWCFDRGLLCGSFHTYLVPQTPLRHGWGGARGDRRVAGRVWARVNSKNFTLTELTCWIDGIRVEGRGVAADCHQDYFWANRGLVNVGEVRGRTKALFDRTGQFRHHGLYSD